MRKRDLLNERVQVGLYIQEGNQTVEPAQATGKAALNSDDAICPMQEE